MSSKTIENKLARIIQMIASNESDVTSFPIAKSLILFKSLKMIESHLQRIQVSMLFKFSVILTKMAKDILMKLILLSS